MSDILAPAGDKNCALAAINAGCDALYVGLKDFSARSSAENFTVRELEDLCRYAHSFGVKVYVALNTLIKDSEVGAFFDRAVDAHNAGADALIISDIFLGAELKKLYPELCLHLSTQAGVCNVYGARIAKEMGFSRVILARETAFEDVCAIAAEIETEVFVQGALCSCFSGQCYFSSFAGGNSGNRGKCKQPCRKKYAIDREGFDDPAYRISLSDLSLGEDIQKYIDAGVACFKIEGRMRRAEYVSAAVQYYRAILEKRDVGSEFSALKRTYNRGNYTKGLAFGQDKSFLSTAVQGHIGEFVGVLKVENGKYTFESGQNFGAGDCFKVLRAGVEVGGAAFDKKEGRKCVVKSNARLKNGDKLFITTDARLNAELLQKSRKIGIEISAEFFAGKRAKVTIGGREFLSENVLERAANRPLSEEDVKSAFSKVDKYPFEVKFSSVATDGVFIPTSELNAFRRKCFAELFDGLSAPKNVKIAKKELNLPQIEPKINKKRAIICEKAGDFAADIAIIKGENGAFKGEKYLYLPAYLTGKDLKKVEEILPDFDGIYTEGLHGFYLAKQFKKPLFAGTGLNISNAVSLANCDAKYIALSKEISAAEANALSRENVFYLTAGDIKVMDLAYCPFGKRCQTCDRRDLYTLTDENGRKFPLRRYGATGDCRFEVFNCAKLISDCTSAGALLDCTLGGGEFASQNFENIGALKGEFKNFTRGHTVNSVL